MESYMDKLIRAIRLYAIGAIPSCDVVSRMSVDIWAMPELQCIKDIEGTKEIANRLVDLYFEDVIK
jgi:hypothetical protein